MKALRLFVALPTPPDVRGRLAEVQRSLRAAAAGVKWEPEEKLHITLKFLGDVGEERVPLLLAPLREAVGRVAPVEVVYEGLGVFPNAREPRILWAGTAPSPTLAAAHRAVESACGTAGFPAEARPFHPHVTLGRVKDPRRAAALTEATNSVMFQPILACIRELHLVTSTLHPEGSTYTLLATIPCSS